MAYKTKTKICKECGKEFSYTFPKDFCNSSCAARYNNRIRKASMRKYYESHPDRKSGDGGGAWFLSDEARRKMRERFDNRPKKLFGLELDISYGDFVKYKESHRTCEICGREEYVSTGGKTTPNSLSIDHQHGTNHFRGMLCQQCNTKLGWFESNKDHILEYINERNI